MSTILAGCGAETLQRPRNVLVIVVDTLRQDHLQCYGYVRETAPTICALAAEGARFDGISPSSWTKPATASILTGLHPVRHQATERNDLLPGAVETLAETLSGAGLRTLGVSVNPWISERFAFDQGFDELVLTKGGAGGGVGATEVNRVVQGMLQDLDEPFFLYLHYTEPHEPYDPPIAWDGGPLPKRLAARKPITKEDLDMANFVTRDPELLRDAIDLYDGEIRHVDNGVAEVLDWLRQRDLLEETLVVVASDHGEEFDEHGRVGHGMNLHREVIRVPLIFHHPPTVPAGTEVGTATLLDVAPTILDFLGLGGGEQRTLDGRSLLPVLRGRERGDPERSYLLHLDLDGRPSLALTRGGSKLVLARDPYRKLLFDLAEDPLEEQNLLVSEPPPEALQALGIELADEYNNLRHEAMGRETTEDAGDLADAIRALGYVSPTRETRRPRLLPHRVRPADAEPGGLLGWETLTDLAECVHTADGEAEPQLLQGWRFVEESLGGRWTLPPEATLVLASPRKVGLVSLVLEGTNYSQETLKLEVRIGSETVSQGSHPPGRLHLEVPLEPRHLVEPHVLVRIAASPPLTPRPPEIGVPHWTLGVFVHSVCLGHVRLQPGSSG